jgi:hypothetical protein
LVSACVALVLISRGQATIIFNFTWGADIPPADLANVQAATRYAANQIRASFSDNVTLNITVNGMAGGVGQSSASLLGPYTFAQVKNALAGDRTTAEDNVAVRSLPLSDPTGGSYFQMSRGLGKGLGLLPGTDSASDGTFSYGTGYAYSFDPNNRAQAGKYDFIGVAEHELTELMGRVVRVNSTGNGWRPMDLFRFTASGRSASAADADVYFSSDSTTLLRKFNANGNGGDLGDWASGQGDDAFNAFAATGAKQDMSAVDLRLMDVIGWNLVPEPAGSTMLALGALTMLAVRKRSGRGRN